MIPLVILTQALFAIIFPIGKIALDHAGPFFLVGLRMLLAGIAMLIFQMWYNPASCRIRKKDISRLILLAFFNIYLTNAYEFWGLQYLSSGKACFIYNITPFIDALISYFAFHEIMTLKKGMGLIIGFIGFIPMIYNESAGESSLSHIGFISTAELALFVAALGTAIGWIIMRTFSRNKTYSFITINAYSMIIGGSMSLLHSMAVEQWYPAPTQAFGLVLSLSLLMGFLQSVLCYNIYAYLLRSYSTTFMSFATFISPLIAAFFGWVILGEKVSWDFYYATIIVSIGLAFFYQEELRLGYVSAPTKP